MEYKTTWVLVATALLIFGLGHGGFQMLADGGAAPGDAPAATPPAPPRAPGQVVIAPSKAVGRLNNGVSIEIVGLCQSPSQGRQWWDAGGAPLETRPYAKMNGELQVDPGYLIREIAIKVSDQAADSPDPASVPWSIDNSGGSSSSTPEDAHGHNVMGIEAERMALKDQPGGVTLHASVAAGKWTTVATNFGSGSMSMDTGTQEFIFGAPFRADNETRMVIAATGLQQLDFRLVAIDRNGREHPASGYTSASSRTGLVCEFGVRGVSVNSIKEWRLQTRPYDQWIEIRNISLHSGQITNVQVVTSDSAQK
jgi:hypothetical protein